MQKKIKKMHFFDKKGLQKGKNCCIVSHHLRENMQKKGVLLWQRISKK